MDFSLPKIAPELRRNIARILPFGLIWLLFGLVFLWSEYVVLGDQTSTSESAITLTPTIFVFSSISVFSVGILVGLVEVQLLYKAFEKRPFAQKIFGKVVFYTLMMSLLIAVLYMIAASIEQQKSFFSREVWEQYRLFFVSITHLSTAVQLITSLMVSLIYAEISDNLGQGVLMNFFTGKYHQPKEEIRVFMFCDMKASTRIAEELGHIRYFELLRAYYSDFSKAIIKNEGEVYQYIGDEIVITWTFKKGIENNNCIHCYFDMQKDLTAKAEWYLKTFGVQPAFKAGMHYGPVTTGEIGALKKEIIFTGDVLNTTARIQSLCGTLQREVLLSGNLVKALNTAEPFQLESLGKQKLRGREETVELFTVSLPTV